MIIILMLVFSAILIGCEKIPDCDRIDGYIAEVCYPSDNLSLNSQGGKITVAIEISNMVYDTHIDGNCSSACVMIASSGVNRSVCHDSWIGLHQGTNDMATKAVLDFFYRDERVDFDEVKRRIDSTPNYSMNLIPADTAKRIGLVDEILYCD